MHHAPLLRLGTQLLCGTTAVLQTASEEPALLLETSTAPLKLMGLNPKLSGTQSMVLELY